jgi:hypothetical protein
MGHGDPKAWACIFSSVLQLHCKLFGISLYFIHCIMIMAGVGQLLDRDTALLFFLASSAIRKLRWRWLNEQSSFLKCRALGAL